MPASVRAEPPPAQAVGTVGLVVDAFPLGWNMPMRVKVQDLVVGGPADRAGIRRDEHILAIDGHAVERAEDAEAAMRGPVGSEVTLSVGPEGKFRAVRVRRAVVDLTRTTCVVGDCVSGVGVQLDAFGNRYEGGFSAGRYAGLGRLRAARGDVIYEGAFERGRRHGHGRLRITQPWSPGTWSFEGEFKDGWPGDAGKVTEPNGDTYEGELQSKTNAGQGRKTRAADGDTWTGTFVGLSVMTSSGFIFEDGIWVHHTPNGRTCTRQVTHRVVASTGRIDYPAGEPDGRLTFDGSFGDDCLAQGPGVMTTATGATRGVFVNDRRLPK